MTTRKSHNVLSIPKSTTLDDLEQPKSTLLQKRGVFQSPPQNSEEDGSILSLTKMLVLH